MAWDEIKKAVNSDLSKPLNTLIAEKADELGETSTTGEGKTVFSLEPQKTAGNTSLVVCARFIAPVSGIYKYNFIGAGAAGKTARLTRFPSLFGGGFFYNNNSDVLAGGGSFAQFDVPIGTGLSSLSNTLVYAMSNNSILTVTQGVSYQLTFSAIRGETVIFAVQGQHSGGSNGVANQVITYGNE